MRATEDLENASSVLVKREEQAALLTQGVDALSRSRGASFAAYQRGAVSLIEVLQADDKLLRASDAQAQAQAQTESARAAVAAGKPVHRIRWRRSSNCIPHWKVNACRSALAMPPRLV